MWARYTESRFTPDHLALHILLDEWVEPADGEQVDLPPVEFLQEICERHEVPEREVVRRQLDQHVHIALRPVIAPGGRPEDADLRHTEPLPEQREHCLEPGDKDALLLTLCPGRHTGSARLLIVPEGEEMMNVAVPGMDSYAVATPVHWSTDTPKHSPGSCAQYPNRRS